MKKIRIIKKIKVEIKINKKNNEKKKKYNLMKKQKKKKIIG